VPGFKVLRWERHWHDEGQPFRDPADYPPISVATSGTHDTEPLAIWWDHASDQERRMVTGLATLQRMANGDDLHAASYDRVRDVLLETLFASRSELLLLPVQDVFGWRERINVPGTVADANWTYRLPWPVDRLDEVPEACERQARLHAWAEKHER
jgi:4-alpha-glucanotransferase